jgi:hypothetical protein
MQGWRAGSPPKLSARVIRLNRRNSITPGQSLRACANSSGYPPQCLASVLFPSLDDWQFVLNFIPDSLTAQRINKARVVKKRITPGTAGRRH